MLLAPDLMLYSGPPPQLVLDQRWLWQILLALIGATLVLRLSGLDIAGALLSGLMLWFGVLMTRDGMVEVAKYSLIYSVLCGLNFFFDILPLITELGGRITRRTQAVGFEDEGHGVMETTYRLSTKTTPFFDSSQGFEYNVTSVAMVVSPVAMALGMYLSISAHNEIGRHLQPQLDGLDNWEGDLQGHAFASAPQSPALDTDPAQSLPLGAGPGRRGPCSPRAMARDTFEQFQGQGHKLANL